MCWRYSRPESDILRLAQDARTEVRAQRLPRVQLDRLAEQFLQQAGESEELPGANPTSVPPAACAGRVAAETPRSRRHQPPQQPHLPGVVDVVHRDAVDVGDARALLARGRAVEVGVSIGVAVSGDGTIDADHLLREADAAMYRAKPGARRR